MNEFSVMLFKNGVKLVLKKTDILGGNEAFIRHHMKSIKDSITGVPIVIKEKDILFVQMLFLMNRGVRKVIPSNRSLFFYTKFLSDIPRIISIENKKTGMKTFVSW